MTFTFCPSGSLSETALAFLVLVEELGEENVDASVVQYLDRALCDFGSDLTEEQYLRVHSKFFQHLARLRRQGRRMNAEDAELPFPAPIASE